ncbi:unnamed protein product [Calypogeia fissa]
MASVLPVYTTPSRGDSPYDNAKVRRKSSLKMAIQAGIAGGAGKECLSCSIGKFLGAVLLLGIGYIAITHTAPLHSAAKLPIVRQQDIRVVKDDDTPGIWGKGVRDRLLNYGFKGEESNHTVPSNVTEIFSDQLNMQDVLWKNRQAEVVGAFRHAWKGYKEYAMGFDELKPIKKIGVDGLGGLGATIVDALDTAIIMGCEDVVQDAASWIEQELPRRLHDKGQVNLFETTIRVLGGLLSAFHLLQENSAMASKITTKPEIFKASAIDLADRLYTAFSDSPTDVPYSDVVLSARKAHPAYNDGGASSTAEVATLQMEFWYLSQVSGDPKYGKAAMKVYEHIKGLHKEQGLVPIFISPTSGQFIGNNIRLGSRGDSYYEYLVKVWLQQGGADNDASPVSYLREMYDEAIAGVRNLLLRTSKPKGLLYVGELPSGIRGDFSPKMDHLVCFLAGTMAIGATRGLSKDQALRRGFMNEKDLESLKIAEDLCHTCYQMYAVTATGLAPEIAYFNMDGEAQSGMEGGKQGAAYGDDILIHALDRHNLLRPETVESLFVLYRVTGEMKYRHWGWEIFQAFETHAKVASGGYSSLDSVTTIPAPKRDKMETFFLGETLKYLYLLFSDSSVLPLDKYVFNTEAHPLPIVQPPASHIKRKTKSPPLETNSQ